MSSDVVRSWRFSRRIFILKQIIIHEHCKHTLSVQNLRKIALHVCVQANVRESEPYDHPDYLKVTILEILKYD